MLKGELPGVSVIILTFNGQKYLDDLLPSLLDQTYPHLKREIIVVDNGSEDETVSHIRTHYPDIKCVALPSNIGFAAGNNAGVGYAGNEFIVFLNQDTICHRNWLYGLVTPLLDDHDIGACASNIIPVAPGSASQIDRHARHETLVYCDLSPFGYGRYHEDTNIALKRTLLVSGCSFIIHRDTIAELGYLFDQRIWMYAEDTDLSLRILRIGKKLYAARDSVVYHLHDNDSSLSNRSVRKAYGAIQNRVYVYLKNMPPLEFGFYFPLMVLGGGWKLFELQMSTFRKALFFIPFSLFTFSAMLMALLTHIARMGIRQQERRRVHHIRRGLLSLLLKRSPESTRGNGSAQDMET